MNRQRNTRRVQRPKARGPKRGVTYRSYDEESAVWPRPAGNRPPKYKHLLFQEA